jgi:translocation and assembly module TamB
MPDTLQLDVQDIDADTLASIRLGRITLADTQGIWFEAEGLSLRWKPSALWHATLHVQELAAQRIHFVRPPSNDEPPQAACLREQMESLQVTLQQLPDTLQGIQPPPLMLETLAVDEIAIDSTVVDLPSRFRLSGNADLVASQPQATMELHSLEGIDTHARIDLEGHGLTAQWREAKGGMLGHMLMLGSPAPTEMKLEATLADGNTLRHSLHLQAAETPLLTATIDLPMTDDAQLIVHATLPNPALFSPLAQYDTPIEMQAMLGENVLDATITSAHVPLSNKQNLTDITITNHIAFEDDPLFAITTDAKATLQQPDTHDMPVHVALQATGDDEKWRIAKLAATAPDMKMDASGAINLKAGTAQLNGTATIPQLVADFALGAQNLLDAPQAQAQLTINTWKQALPAPLDAVLATPLIIRAAIQPAEVAVTVSNTNIDGKATLHPNAQDTEPLAMASASIGGLPVPLALEATHYANGSGHVRATSAALQVLSQYAITPDSVALNNILLNAEKGMDMSGNIIIDTTTAMASGTIKGAITSTAPFNSLGVTLPEINLAKGALTLKLGKTSTSQQAELRIETGAVTVDRHAVADNLNLNAQAILPKNSAPQLNAKLSAAHLASPLLLDSAQLDIQGDTTALNWKASAAQAAINGIFAANGTLALDDSIALAVNNLNATWQKNRLTLQQPAHIRYGEKEIAVDEINLLLNDSASLKASATLHPDRTQGAFSIAKLPLQALPNDALTDVHGILDGTLTINGTPDNPNIDWNMAIDGLQQNYPQMAKLREQPVTVTLRGGLQRQELSAQLSVNAPDAESFAAANLTMPMTVSLRPDAMQFAPKGSVNADMKADMILAPFLPLFLPDGIYGAGHLVTDLSIKGTLKNPILQGDVDLHSGQIEVLQTGTLIDKLTLRLEARNSRITITEGSATDGAGGTLDVGGHIELSPSLPMDMRAALKNFVAVRHPSATANLSGSTTLKGDLTDALLKGDWKVNSAKILIQKTGDSVTELNVVEVESLDSPLDLPTETDGQTPEEKSKSREERRRERPFTRNLALDMNIAAENQIFLDGFGLNAELKGAVAVTGTAARPKLDGKMETVRGRWEFFGRTFNIVRGEAVLSEQNLSAPLINIRAEAKADDVLAIAQISGSTNNPKIEFSSIPSLPKDEILSRVMFGRNLNSISPFQALQLADMLRSLSGSGDGRSLNPLSKLQDTLGIDELKINNDSGSTEDVTVGVGKYVRENVYLEVEGGAGENSGKVSVEVDLTPSISVETEARQNAESAVRLNYKYDY